MEPGLVAAKRLLEQRQVYKEAEDRAHAELLMKLSLIFDTDDHQVQNRYATDGGVDPEST